MARQAKKKVGTSETLVREFKSYDGAQEVLGIFENLGDSADVDFWVKGVWDSGEQTEPATLKKIAGVSPSDAAQASHGDALKASAFRVTAQAQSGDEEVRVTWVTIGEGE